MVHPRLYWGEVGNDLVPALIELPISSNHRPDGWEKTADFRVGSNDGFSARRTYFIFNQNGWARSLHFLAGWLFVVGGSIYAFSSLGSGHLRRQLLPDSNQLSLEALKDDVKRHLVRDFISSVGPPYGPLQRISYVVVGFLLLPLMVVSGLTMSPAVTAGWPWLLDLFGGYQSARTIHFFAFVLLLLFLLVHLVMVKLTGARKQLRAMVLGGPNDK